MVRKPIEDNDPSDNDICLEECVVQALTVWWLSTNRPAIWKSEKIRQGFVKLHMPGIYACLIKRHPTSDPTPPEPTPQNGPQPGTSGQMSTRPDFFRELSCLIQTSENAYGIVCMTNLPNEDFVYIRQEHTHFGLSIKGIQGRIAFPVLAIWYILAKGKYHVIPVIKDVFHDLEMEDECAKIIDKFPGVVDRNLRDNRTPNKIQM